VFDVPENQLQGVYVWSVPYGGTHVAYYVGETGRSFNDRLRDHASQYLGGIYRLYDPAEFARCERGQPVWEGLWRDGITHRMGHFLGNYDHYSKVAYDLLGTMRLWLLPFAEDERTRKRIEAAIGKRCREAPEPGARFFDEVVRFQAAPDPASPLVIETPSGSPLLGVPTEFGV
jgi:hypothetical protein